MGKIKGIFLSIVVFGLLFSCRQTLAPEEQQTAPLNNTHYVSMDGLWRVTPETSIKYPHGTLEPILQIHTDAQGKLTAQGCFLWDKRFYDYWPISSIQYNDSARQLVIGYDEEGTCKGTVDNETGIIQGIACWGDPSDTSKLDFIRAEELDVNKLFVPYPPGEDGSIRYTYHQPENCMDQLQTASLFDFVKDSIAFYKLIERIITQKFGRLESLLILKDQKLILEEYFYGNDRTQLHHIHSCTKGVVSLLLGIALDHHQMMNVDQPVFDFFPDFDSLQTPEKKEITLRHVLTMTAGFSEDDNFEIDDPDDQVKQILSLPQESTPGEEFAYNNNCTNLLGGIIYTLERKQADEFAKEVLFNKLGISTYIWERENGVVHCYSDLHMYPRDMAKIGLLVLKNGSWNGEQIVPEEWIAESTKPYVAESEFFDYGYQWWYRSKRNKSWWENPLHGSNNEHEMFLALGYGGQYIMVIRDLNMVIAITSSDYNEENGLAHQKVPMVIEEVVPLFN